MPAACANEHPDRLTTLGQAHQAAPEEVRAQLEIDAKIEDSRRYATLLLDYIACIRWLLDERAENAQTL